MEVANGLGNVPAYSQPAVSLIPIWKLISNNGALLPRFNAAK